MTKTTAYKGFLIVENQSTGTVKISKDGFHISWSKTVDAAKKEIDLLA